MILKNFAPEYLRDWVFYSEIIAAVLALIFYYKYKGTFLRYFVILIWYSIANEFLAKYYSENINKNNHILFNIYRVVEFSFYFFLYRNIIETKLYKKIITIFSIIYYVSVLINCFFQDFRYQYFSNTYFIGALFIIISIVFYFSEILNSEKIISFTKTFIFWISIAVFLLYITSIPFKVMTNFYQDLPVIPYIYIANYAVVFIFCLLISVGLIWSKAEK